MGNLGKECIEHSFQPPNINTNAFYNILATSQQQGKQKTDERVVTNNPS
jgi:hypothetical protein